MKESPEVHFTPEQELLLWSIRVDHTKDQWIEEILKDGVDWNYVRETAIQHGIIPLLYKRLKEEMSDFVPPQELEELRTLFMANAVQNLRMTQQLIKVLDLLADGGIEAMPFKGPALAVQAYGDLSMRSFCDLDILVDKRNFLIACDILISNDYTPLFENNQKKVLNSGKELHFFSNNYNFDIHWRIVDRYRVVDIDLEQVWARAQSLTLNGREIATISPEDTVIILCIHGTKHSWKELKWLADLIFFIAHNSDLKWNELLICADQIGVRRIISLALCLAQEYGGVKYPQNVEDSIRSDEVEQKITSVARTRFFQQMEHTSNLSLIIFYVKSRERFLDQMKVIYFYFIDVILTPSERDFNFVTLPPSLFFLYIAIRPFRVLKEYHCDHLRTFQECN